MKTATLESKFPLLAVENGCIISKDADITVAYRVELPELFTLTRAEYESMHSTWAKAVKVLPNYSIVHKQDFFIEGEQVLMEFMSSRYVLAVTERKLIAIRIEAFTGRHKAALILPYSKMTAFSVELVEEDDDQIEFCIWTPSIDMITFYFNNGIIDIKAFLSIIAKHIQ